MTVFCKTFLKVLKNDYLFLKKIQDNTWDCGLYTAGNVEAILLSGVPQFREYISSDKWYEKSASKTTVKKRDEIEANINCKILWIKPIPHPQTNNEDVNNKIEIIGEVQSG